VGILSELLSVLHGSWHFDRTTEAVVSVALLVGDLFDFSLGKAGGVHGDCVVNWQGSS